MAVIKNGRQTATTLDGIRDDHLARYTFAVGHALRHRLLTAVDAGAGIGYGSWMLANAGLTVEAHEIDQAAIDYGQQHYSHDNLARIQSDITELEIPDVDLLTAFEIVEHCAAAPAFLARAAGHARWLIASVPNERVIPFAQNKHREHVRHYTAEQFREMLDGAGWEVISLGSQQGKKGDDAEVWLGDTSGRTLIAVCRAK